MEDGKRYAPESPEEENWKEYEDQAEELLKRSSRETRNSYDGQNGYGDSRGQQKQYGYSENYGQQYGYDPRYAQSGNNNGYNQYGYDPNYGQQYGYDPNYGQQYGYDPRYAQSGNNNGYNQYGYDPNYGRQQYGYDPNYGQQQYGNPYYAQQDGEGYGRKYSDEEQKEYSGRRAGIMGDRIHESYDTEDEDEYYEDDEENEEEYADEEEEEERPARRGKKATGLKALKKKLSKIPSKTLLLIGGAIVAILLITILLVALLPKNAAKPSVEVASTQTPEADKTPEPTPEATPEPTATPHPITTPLNFGMESDIVADIQQRLIDLGYMEYPVVDGIQQVTTMYGKTTKNAIRTFQSKNGLDTDGQCGQATYDVLMSDTAKAYFVSRGDEDTGTNGPVRRMQNRLIELGFMEGSATGHCGDSTVVAVQKFQKANGLDADGKAGAQTLELMYSDDAIGKDGTKVPYATPEPTPVATPKAEAEETTAVDEDTGDDAE